MTYKLNSELAQITSPVTLIFPDSSSRKFDCGRDVAETVFGEKYQVVEIRAVENEAYIFLSITKPIPVTWDREENLSFF